MTREEIGKAFNNYEPDDPYLTNAGAKCVDFALEMVRRHNEECAKLADYFSNEFVGVQIAKLIREAKP